MLEFARQAAHNLAIFVLPFLIVLTLVVTIHEFGHFLAARLFGVKIERFSIGFGRALLSRRDRQGVEWRLGWLPLGGYVKFAGDANAASAVPDAEDLDALRQEIVATHGAGAERQFFHFKPVWQRAIVVAAGPIANFVLSIALYTFLFSAIGVYVSPARVQQVMPGSPAAAAGFRQGDLIVRAGAERVESVEQAQQVIALSADTPVRFVVRRGGGEVVLTATPQRRTTNDPIAGQQRLGVLGVLLGPNRDEPARYVRYPVHQAVAKGAHESWRIVRTTVVYIGRIAAGKESGDALGGPLRTAKISGAIAENAAQAAAPGDLAGQTVNVALALLNFTAFFSVSVGFLNLLPVPVLDGGHLLFYAYEAVARKPLGAKVQEAGFRVGLALLLGLMLFATWNDLQKLSVFKIVGGLFS